MGDGKAHVVCSWHQPKDVQPKGDEREKQAAAAAALAASCLPCHELFLPCDAHMALFSASEPANRRLKHLQTVG